MESDLDEVRSTFSQILEVACSEYFIAGRSLKINCSIGVAVAPHHGQTCEDLERFADAALNVAKSKGRGACVVFDDTLRDALRSRSVMGIAVRDAVHCHTIMPWFQPIYDIDGQRMASLEILARWNSPGHGFIPPSTFLPIAGELGLLDALDSQVARAAFISAREWVKNNSLVFP